MKATLLLLISMKEFSIKAKPKKRWIFVCASTQTHFLINSDSQAFLQQYKADSGLITKQTLPMGPNTLPFPAYPLAEEFFKLHLASPPERARLNNELFPNSPPVHVTSRGGIYRDDLVISVLSPSGNTAQGGIIPPANDVRGVTLKSLDTVVNHFSTLISNPTRNSLIEVRNVS